ncbi:MAG TPA: hypothetical protein VGH40_17640 [Roseiarcus sp.]|jgi:hypothetical protein
MKPVPISQYLDHVGRAARSESPEPPVFKPRVIRAVQDAPRPAPAMARVLREAATGGRSAQPREERRERSNLEDAWAPPPESVVPPRPEPPAVDVEKLVAEAYERGLREGAATARAEDAETLAREQAAVQQRGLESQIDFQANEYARVAEALSTGLAEMEDRIAASVTRILAPLLSAEMTKRVVEELCDDIARLCSGGSQEIVKIRGPERLLKLLRERVAGLPAEVEFVGEDAVEVTVEAQHTLIRSQLRPWEDLIASFVI